MSRGKAFRQHHFQRCLKSEFRKLWHGWLYSRRGHSDENRIEAWQRAKFHVNNQKKCSCWMCGNTRKLYGNSKIPYTLQERRAAVYWKEMD